MLAIRVFRVLRVFSSMSDRASDTSEIVAKPSRSRDRAPLEAADIIRLLQQAAAGTRATSQRAADGTRMPSAGPEKTEGETGKPGADGTASAQSEDALELLQELARKSGDDQTRQAPVGAAASAAAICASTPTVAGVVPGDRRHDRRIEPDRALGGIAAAGARTQRPPDGAARCRRMSGDAGGRRRGVFSSWDWIAADQPTAAVDASAAATSDPPAVAVVQARPNIPVQTAMEECDAQAAKNPFTMYFLVSPVALGSDVRPDADAAAARRRGLRFVFSDVVDRRCWTACATIR